MSVTDYEKIRLRAFQIWEAEGRPEGRDMEHWVRAENELSMMPVSKRTPSSPSTKVTASPSVVAKKPAPAKAAPKVVAKAAPKAAPKAAVKAAPIKRGKPTAKA